MKAVDRLASAILTASVILGGVFVKNVMGQEKAAILGVGPASLAPIQVVPGGILTMVATGFSPSAVPSNADRTPLPASLAGISATVQQSYSPMSLSVPLISVWAAPTCYNDLSTSCSSLTLLRLQIPFEAIANVPGTSTAPNLVRLFVSDEAGNSAAVDLNPLPDQIHILRQGEPVLTTGQPLRTHADGSLVTSASPARSGEELVVYAVGLGLTVPQVASGTPSPSPPPGAAASFLLNFVFSMIGGMATVHMTEGEVINNFATVLENIRKGIEVVVEQDHRPVALIRAPRRSGRPISECIASAKASGSRVTLDGGFARDVEEGIRDRQEPWNPPSWD